MRSAWPSARSASSIRPWVYHRHAEGQVGDAGDWLIGPAVLPGQLDRLQAPLHPQLERPPAQQLGQVRQAGNLQVRPSYAAGQGDAVVEVPVRLVEASGPRLGDAKVDQRQRPQVPAQLGPAAGARSYRAAGARSYRAAGARSYCAGRRHRGGQQPLRLPGHGREVPALAGQAHPHDREYGLRSSGAAGRH